jgi:hypothetical protein
MPWPTHCDVQPFAVRERIRINESRVIGRTLALVPRERIAVLNRRSPVLIAIAPSFHRNISAVVHPHTDALTLHLQDSADFPVLDPKLVVVLAQHDFVATLQLNDSVWRFDGNSRARKLGPHLLPGELIQLKNILPPIGEQRCTLPLGPRCFPLPNHLTESLFPASFLDATVGLEGLKAFVFAASADIHDGFSVPVRILANDLLDLFCPKLVCQHSQGCAVLNRRQLMTVTDEADLCARCFGFG